MNAVLDIMNTVLDAVIGALAVALGAVAKTMLANIHSTEWTLGLLPPCVRLLVASKNHF